jgi:serine racemase
LFFFYAIKGNHGVALSLAASQCGCSAAVVLPHTTAASKKQAIVLNGGTLVYCEPTMESRELVCAEWQQVRGATFVPSSNSDLIIAGQGTVALEMLEQAEHLDSIIVPVSGGGLISGVAIAAKAINPNIKIYGAEPSGRNNAADAAASKAAGKLVTMESPQTIASGLQARLGSLTWPIVHELVEDIIVVNDDEIREAMYNCFKYLKVVVEPSGAAALAAACNETFIRSTQGRQNVGVILSGGNIDVEECFPLLREHSPTQQ